MENDDITFQEKKPINIFAIIIIIIIFVAIISIGGYFYYKNNKIEEEKEAKPLPKHTLNIIIKDGESGEKLYGQFSLKNEFNGTVHKGFIKPEAITQYKEAEENTTYYIIAQDNDNIQPDYYEDKQICQVTTQDAECTIYLYKEGNPYITYLNINKRLSKIWIYNEYGAINKPMICFSYSGDFEKFTIKDKEKINPPEDLQISYDFCIMEDTIINDYDKIIEINHKGEGNIKVLLRDFCITYINDNCGIEDKILEFSI